MAADEAPCYGYFAGQWPLACHSDLAAAAVLAAGVEAAQGLDADAEVDGNQRCKCVCEAGSCSVWQALPDSVHLQIRNNYYHY